MKEDKLKAKMEMLKELKQMMRQNDIEDLGKKLNGKIKKVTIASPSEEGLEKGLSLAEKILEKRKMQKEEPSMEQMDDMEEMDEDSEECPICGENHEEKYACGGVKEE